MRVDGYEGGSGFSDDTPCDTGGGDVRLCRGGGTGLSLDLCLRLWLRLRSVLGANSTTSVGEDALVKRTSSLTRSLTTSSMPKGGDVKARLRKKLYEKSLALQEEARRVAEERDALQAKHTKETIDKIIELKVLRTEGEALLSDLDALVEQIKVDGDNAKTEDERGGASLALERLAIRREELLKSNGDWDWSIHHLEEHLRLLRGS